MVTENGVSLQVDPQRRIGVTDVINMLKGLRSEAVIKIVKTSEPNENKVDTAQSQSVISPQKNLTRLLQLKAIRICHRFVNSTKLLLC